MELVIFDLEWNGSFDKLSEKYINEIIEIGAVRLGDNLELRNEFSVLIRPQIGKKLCSSVRNLTSITDEELAHGVPFPYAYKKFSKFCENAVVMTWSTSDLDALLANVRYHYGKNRLKFMRYYADLQKYCGDRLQSDSCGQLGLQTAAEMLSIPQDEIPHHRALDDSRLSAECLRRLYDVQVFQEYIEDSGKEEFYEKLFFKPYNITDPESPLIDKDSMYFDCPECGARAKRTDEWKEKYKFFCAGFLCPQCGLNFVGRIQFRKKYDRVNVIKKINLPEAQDNGSSE